jgi:hypothetical protein
MSTSHIFTSDLTLAITRRRGLSLNFLGIIKGDMKKVKHKDKNITTNGSNNKLQT